MLFFLLRTSPRSWLAGFGLLAPAASATSAPAPTPPIAYHFQHTPSVKARFQAFVLRHFTKPAAESRAVFEQGDIYRWPEEVAALPKLSRRVATLRIQESHQRRVFTLLPKQAVAPKVVLYLHGGAYIHTFGKQHWRFLEEVVAQTGYTVVAPDYPLAPQHTYQDAFAMVEPLYRDLVANAGAANVVLMGDAAGGGFALALAEKLRQDHLALPAQLILLSPWLDATLTNPAIEGVEALDPLLSRTALRYSAEAYAGKTPLSSYQLSPLNGNLAGLPPISVFTSTYDVLYPDAQRLRQQMAAQGTPVSFFAYDHLLHGWMLRKMPEARKARKQIMGLLKS